MAVVETFNLTPDQTTIINIYFYDFYFIHSVHQYYVNNIICHNVVQL